MSDLVSDAVEVDGAWESDDDASDRTGLPTIPRGRPSANDRIDIGRIEAEFSSRATKRAAAAAYQPVRTAPPPAVPLRAVTTSEGGHMEVKAAEEEDEFDDFSYDPPERRSTHHKLPRRTALTAIFLLFVGVVFSTLGITFVFTLGINDALPFLIIGGISFIPGSYASFILYHAWKGTPGYSYDQIPSHEP